MADTDSKPIYDAIDGLTEADMERAALQALRDVDMHYDPGAPEVTGIVSSLRWQTAALHRLPVQDLVDGAAADGGRGLRGELVFHFETDEGRRDSELDLLLVILLDRNLDLDTCTMDEYSDLTDTIGLLLEDAAGYLFEPVVAAVRALYHKNGG